MVNIYDAKTHLSRLVERVRNGEEIIIAKAGRPVARLIAIDPVGPRIPGSAKGKIFIGEDFLKPLPDDVLDLFDK